MIRHFLAMHGAVLESDPNLLGRYVALRLPDRRILLSFDVDTGATCYRAMAGERELWGECPSVEAALAAAMG